MTIKQICHRFRLEANLVDSKSTQGLSTAATIDFINDGMLQLLRTRYGNNNNYRASLEEIQKRIDEWQRLIVPHHILDGNQDENREDIYSFDLKEAKEYMFLLRCSFIASKGECKNKPIYITHNLQSDDLNINFDNPNSSSNFEWREINYRLAQDKILAYTDSTFSIQKADIDFLRYPVKVDIAGYTHFDNTNSADVECELPDFLHPEIVNEAVAIFKLALNHPDSQAALSKRQMQE